MPEAPDAIKLVRFKLIQIGWRRGLLELKRRGYSEPTAVIRDEPTVIAKFTEEPGLLPGCTFKPEGARCPDPRGIAFIGTDWTGDWSAWGWDADGKYWGVDRQVSRRVALAEVLQDFARNERCEGFGESV
jgi:hypothetical protein